MPTRFLLRLAGLLAVVGLIGLAVLAPPDGQERGDLPQFLGNLHPLAVHLPIALLLLIPVLEIAGRHTQRRALRTTAGFVLGLAALSAIATPYLGWLLAWSGGFEGGFVTQHMWGGIAVAVVALLCWILRSRTPEHIDTLPASYLGMLGLSVVIIAFTGYRGGQLAHGEDHLTKHLPPALQAWLGRTSHAAIAGTPKTSFYAVRVGPIFDTRCVVCHGANKQKGRLRLDSYESLIRGGEDGPVIKAGDAQASELLRRVNLDPSDKDFMPGEGKPPLSEADRKVLELWISAGASPTLPVSAVSDAPPIEGAANPLAPDYRPDETRIARLAAALGVRLIPRSQNPTDGLVLRTASNPAACDDAVLAKLAPVARYIVDAELARTRVTDAGAEALVQFTHLRWLDLSNTAVTPAGVKKLARLSELQTLNLTNTAVLDTDVDTLRNKNALQHIYIFRPAFSSKKTNY